MKPDAYHSTACGNNNRTLEGEREGKGEGGGGEGRDGKERGGEDDGQENEDHILIQPEGVLHCSPLHFLILCSSNGKMMSSEF